MAQGGATSTGLKEMRSAVETLPAAMTSALRAVAWRSSRTIYATAKRLLISQQKTSSRKLADGLRIIEEADKKQFVVLSEAPSDQPANVPIWNEHGTRFMTARPYMRPSLDAESQPYRDEMARVSEDTARKVLG